MRRGDALEELAARGLSRDAVVEIVDEAGHRTVEVRVRADDEEREAVGVLLVEAGG